MRCAREYECVKTPDNDARPLFFHDPPLRSTRQIMNIVKNLYYSKRRNGAVLRRNHHHLYVNGGIFFLFYIDRTF